MPKKLIFISKDSNWQLYRNEILTKLGFEYDWKIEILTTGELKPYLKENERLHYKFFPNLFKQKSKVSFFPAAIKYILRTHPDVVLALNNVTQITEYAVLLACKFYKIRFVWWTHGFNHYELKNKSLQSLKAGYALQFLNRGNAIITFSNKGKEYLVGRKINTDKIFVANNTLDTDKIEAAKNKAKISFNKNEFLKTKFKDYNSNIASIVLLFTGRLNKAKKVNNAISVLSKLKKQGKNAYMLIAGDGEEKMALLDYAKKLDVADSIYFAGAVYDEQAISAYFLAADLFIMPGYIGLAIVHAFAFSLPVFTENVKTHSPEIEYLKEGVNGFITPENDINKTVSLINEVMTEDELYIKLRQGAFDTFKNEANVHNMIKNMNLALQS